MNPLLFYNRIKDTLAPALKALLVIPIKPESRVNGSAREQIFPLTRTKNNTYILKQLIKTKGPIGLAITGYDQANDVYNKFAFYKTILKLNSRTVFHQQYDIFDFAITNQVDIEIFYPQKAKNNIVYHKLFIEPYNQLPFYDRSLGNGIIAQSDSSIDIQIEVSDFAGNISKIMGTIETEKTNSVKMQILHHENQSVFLNLQTPNNLKGLDFFSSIDNQTWQPIIHFEIHKHELMPEYQQFLIKLILPDTLQPFIKANIISDNNEASMYGTILDSIQLQDIKLEIANLGKSILLDFSPIETQSGLTLTLDNDLQTYTVIPEIVNNHFEYVIPSAIFNTSQLKVTLSDHQATYIDTILNLQKMIPEKYQRIGFYQDSVQIISRPQSVYDTLLFDVRKSNWEEFYYNVPLLSPFYIFNSAYQALKSRVEIAIKLDSLDINPKRIGIYTIDRKNKLELIDSRIDTNENIITGKLEAFGLYFVAADTIKPELEVLNLNEKQIFKSLDLIQFMAKDDQSGIGEDINIHISIDNQFVLPEWDPERDLITGHPHWDIKSGIHEIIIEVTDMAGNKSMQRLTVTVEE